MIIGGGAGRRGGGRRAWCDVAGRRTVAFHGLFAPSGCLPPGRARTQTGWVRALRPGEANADGAAFGFPFSLFNTGLNGGDVAGPSERKNIYIYTKDIKIYKSTIYTSARQFARMANELSHWELDALGRALSLRDFALSGRHLAPYQLEQLSKFEFALAKTALRQQSDILTRAAYFYCEVSHVP